MFTCYSPVCHFTRRVAPAFSFDLHVLGTPPALILSQDQTLQLSRRVLNTCVQATGKSLRNECFGHALSSFQRSEQSIIIGPKTQLVNVWLKFTRPMTDEGMTQYETESIRPLDSNKSRSVLNTRTASFLCQGSYGRFRVLTNTELMRAHFPLKAPGALMVATLNAASL